MREQLVGRHVAGVVIEHLLGDRQRLHRIRAQRHLAAGQAAGRPDKLPEETRLADRPLMLGRPQRLARLIEPRLRAQHRHEQGDRVVEVVLLQRRNPLLKQILLRKRDLAQFLLGHGQTLPEGGSAGNVL